MPKTAIDDIVLTRDNVWGIYAPLYDKFTPHFQRDLLKEAAQNAQGVFLDAGMGVGKLLQYLGPDIGAYCGIDSNPAMVAYASNHKTASFPTAFIWADVQSIPFTAETFDSAASINVLYSVAEPIKHLREIHRVLRENGKLTLVSLAPGCDIVYLEKLAEKDIASQLQADESLRSAWESYITCNKFLNSLTPDGFKPWQYSEDEISNLLEGNGFRVSGIGQNNYFGNLFHVVAEKL